MMEGIIHVKRLNSTILEWPEITAELSSRCASREFFRDIFREPRREETASPHLFPLPGLGFLRFRCWRRVTRNLRPLVYSGKPEATSNTTLPYIFESYGSFFLLLSFSRFPLLLPRSLSLSRQRMTREYRNFFAKFFLRIFEYDNSARQNLTRITRKISRVSHFAARYPLNYYSPSYNSFIRFFFFFSYF